MAYVAADGPGPTQKVTSVTGGGLTWTLVARSNSTWGTTEVWQAKATGRLSPRQGDGQAGQGGVRRQHHRRRLLGRPPGRSAAFGTGAGLKGAPSAKVTPTAACGSAIWGVGHDWTKDTAPVAVPGQSFVHTFIDKRVHDSFWTQKVDAATTSKATVTVAVTKPTKDRWTMVAVEIPARARARAPSRRARPTPPGGTGPRIRRSELGDVVRAAATVVSPTRSIVSSGRRRQRVTRRSSARQARRWPRRARRAAFAVGGRPDTVSRPFRLAFIHGGWAAT